MATTADNGNTTDSITTNLNDTEMDMMSSGEMTTEQMMTPCNIPELFRNLVNLESSNCDRDLTISYIVGIALIVLLLIIVIMLAVTLCCQCMKKTSQEKKPSKSNKNLSNKMVSQGAKGDVQDTAIALEVTGASSMYDSVAPMTDTTIKTNEPSPGSSSFPDSSKEETKYVDEIPEYSVVKKKKVVLKANDKSGNYNVLVHQTPSSSTPLETYSSLGEPPKAEDQEVGQAGVPPPPPPPPPPLPSAIRECDLPDGMQQSGSKNKQCSIDRAENEALYSNAAAELQQEAPQNVACEDRAELGESLYMNV